MAVQGPTDADDAGLPVTDDGFLSPFLDLAQQSPERVFASFPGRELTFDRLAADSRRLAAWLASQGVTGGDRVALMLRNGELALGFMLAIARAGAVWVPVNTQAVGDNLAYVLTHAEPRVVVVEADLHGRITACGAGLGPSRVVSAATVASELADGAAAGALAQHPLPAPDDTYAIMYTSGTTGRPKGVLVSHRMLRIAGEAAALMSGARDGDVLYLWEPMFHIGGAQMLVLPLIRRVHLVIRDRFSASRFWSDCQASRVTHIHFLGGILQMLLKQPTSALDRSHGVRVAWGGGCPADVWAAFQARFGVDIRECYGMTECSSFTTANVDGVVGSVGKPLPWFDVRLVDGDGRDVAAGDKGEMVVGERLRGALSRGYFKDTEATDRAFKADGFHTGDLASRDAEGYLYFHGRMTDSVRVRGENISALEVEAVARQHLAVEDCAVIGVNAEIGEAEIKLLVELKVGAQLSESELSRWLASRLARYQRPRYIAIVAGFERTPSQRIMKHKLSRRTDDAWDAVAG